MLDVPAEEIEMLIKDGIANLYWLKDDFYAAWLRCGVSMAVKTEILRLRVGGGQKPSKRKQMDVLYERMRSEGSDRLNEVSRNFVRLLIDCDAFTSRNLKHRIEIAQQSANRLRELTRQ